MKKRAIKKIPISIGPAKPKAKNILSIFEEYQRKTVAIKIAQLRNPNVDYTLKEKLALNNLKDRLDTAGLKNSIDWS